MSHLIIGVSRANITPPVGMLMSGYGSRKTPAVGVHDELYLVAIYMNDEITESALITMDIIDTDMNGTAKIRKACSEFTNIPSENIMVACSHTHGGPQTNLYGEDLEDKLKEAYSNILVYKAAGALSEAKRNAVPVSVGYARQDCYIAANRRERRPDGVVVLGYNPDGPIAPYTDVIRFDRLDNKEPIAVIFSYSAHGTTLTGDNYLYTADYPGYAKQVIEKQLPTVISSFIAGCSGDINPYPRGTYELCERHGKRLGCAVVQATLDIEDMKDNVRIAVASDEFQLNLESPPSLDEAKEKLAKAKESAEREISAAREAANGKPINEKMALQWYTARELADMTALVNALETGKKDFYISMETQAIAIGDCAIVGMPGEVFVNIGLTVAERSPFSKTIPISHTNGSAGYIPTADQVPLGGYEIEMARARKYGLHIVPESDQVLINSALTSLNKCYEIINRH